MTRQTAISPELEDLREQRVAVIILINLLEQRGAPAYELQAERDTLTGINARIATTARNATNSA